MVGSSTSTTVTSCSADEALPKASIAVQTTLVVPTGYGALIGSPSLRALVMVSGAVQLSLATGLPSDTSAEPSVGSLGWVMSAGATIVGLTSSAVLTSEKRMASLFRPKKFRTRLAHTPVLAF